MIEKIKKILIYGIKKDISAFFEKAQKKGFLEFIGPVYKKMPLSLKKYIDAIKILKEFPKTEKKIEFKRDTVVDKILELKKTLDNLEDSRKKFIKEANIASVFGDFSKEDIKFIEKEGNLIFQFFLKKSSKKKKYEDLIYIGTDYDLDYFVSISKEKKSYKNFFEIFLENPIGILRKKIDQINDKILFIQEELKSYTFYLDFLKKELINNLNNYNLEVAKNNSKEHLEESLFSIEAWIPLSKMDEMNELIKNYNIYYEEIGIEKKEIIPTFLKNNKIGVMGEDLINIYDTPSIQDKDPSGWVLGAFSLFFAMIISDAGYGFLYFILAIFLKFVLKKEKFKRFINLVFLLSISCMFWGIITSSFFGLNINPKSPLKKFSFVDYLSEKKAFYHLTQKDDVYKTLEKKYPNIKEIKDGKSLLLIKKISEGKEKFVIREQFNNNILLEISLLIGVLHLIISFLINVKRNIAGIGWILFMIGGYLYFPSIIKASSLINFLNILSKEEAFYLGRPLVFIGILLAVILALLQKKKEGIKEITNLVSIFGDTMSYLRLYALGMAGMILSKTFNDIGFSINIFLGIFVIIIGHLVNMTLGIIGGVIHGLRLNFLEWYRHCFQGGGKLFNPLKLLK
ncbi:MAG: hypothetical protein AMS24_03375 [Chlamydiae bacterium SM23_39]|nr:MAG: hypothetical protein AMS24_03375 [Chlamydiae bacterium SM23_39]